MVRKPSGSGERETGQAAKGARRAAAGRRGKAVSKGSADLVAAALEGDIPRLRDLLARGAGANAASAEPTFFGGQFVCLRKVTPLHAAAGNGHAGAVTALLEAGAEPDPVASDGFTPLLLASSLGHAAAVSRLAAHGADLEARTSWGDTPLIQALQFERLEAARALLDAGADVEGRSRAGQTGFLAGVEAWLKASGPAAEGLAALVEAMLAKGADVNARGFLGRTAVHDAARAGRVDALERLLAAGASPDVPDSFGSSPAVDALAHAGVLRRLLDAGADPRRRDQAGRSLAWLAAHGGRHEALLLLAAAGADLEAPDARGKSPLAVASEAGDEGTAELLCDLGVADPEGRFAHRRALMCLRRASEEGSLAEVARLLSLGADPNDPALRDRPPLRLAVQGGHVEVALALLGAGAKVGASGPFGESTLLLAAERGLAPLVEALLRAGAPPGERNEDGEGALLLAARSGSARAVAALREAGLKATALEEIVLATLDFPERLAEKVHAKALASLQKLLGPPLDFGALRGGRAFALPAPRTQAAAEDPLDRAAERAAHLFVEARAGAFLASGGLLLHVHLLPGSVLAYLPTADALQAVACLGPFPKGVPAMLRALAALAEEHPFRLHGASYDTLYLAFPRKSRTAAEALAARLFRFGSHERCVLKDGADVLVETGKELAAELAAGPAIVRLWWD